MDGGGTTSWSKPASSMSAAQAAALGGPAANTMWQKAQLLLHGFQQPGLEREFVSYMYQHTLVLDACAASYHALMTLAVIFAFPLSTWRQLEVQLGVLGYVLCWCLPACLVWRFRQRLGPRGREAGAVMVDLALMVQVRQWIMDNWGHVLLHALTLGRL